MSVDETDGSEKRDDILIQGLPQPRTSIQHRMIVSNNGYAFEEVKHVGTMGSSPVVHSGDEDMVVTGGR